MSTNRGNVIGTGNPRAAVGCSYPVAHHPLPAPPITIAEAFDTANYRRLFDTLLGELSNRLCELPTQTTRLSCIKQQPSAQKNKLHLLQDVTDKLEKVLPELEDMEQLKPKPKDGLLSVPWKGYQWPH